MVESIHENLILKNMPANKIFDQKRHLWMQ